jgi:hypothetical protein
MDYQSSTESRIVDPFFHYSVQSIYPSKSCFSKNILTVIYLICAECGMQWYRVVPFAGCMAAMKICRRASPRGHCRTWQVALCRASVSATRTAIWRSRCWTARCHAPVSSSLASIPWVYFVLVAVQGGGGVIWYVGPSVLVHRVVL